MIFDLFGNAYASETEPLGIPYMGSKRKYADALICRMLEIKPHAKYFYDLFGGGGAMSFAAAQKGMTVFYNEKQTHMVSFMRFIFQRMKEPRGKYGMFPDEFYQFVTRDQFVKVKGESGVYAQFVRICYSFGNNQKNYMFNRDLEALKHLAHDVVVFRCAESLRKLNDTTGASFLLSVAEDIYTRRLDFYKQVKSHGKRLDLQQLQQLEPKIIFSNLDYRHVEITTPLSETIIYLDPPYRGTAKYIEGVCHKEIDDFFLNLPCIGFMSEYQSPFLCVHEIKTRSTLSASSNVCAKTEKLYINQLAAQPGA